MGVRYVSLISIETKWLASQILYNTLMELCLVHGNNKFFMMHSCILSVSL